MLDKLKLVVAKLWSNDLVERAVWTALQAGVAVWSLSGFQLDKATLGAVVGAVLSALKTYIVAYVKGRRS